MVDIVKTLDMKFKLLAVINRDPEAMLERARERAYTRRVKAISKILEEINDLKIMAIEKKRLQQTKNKRTLTFRTNRC